MQHVLFLVTLSIELGNAPATALSKQNGVSAYPNQNQGKREAPRLRSTSEKDVWDTNSNKTTSLDTKDTVILRRPVLAGLDAVQQVRFSRNFVKSAIMHSISSPVYLFYEDPFDCALSST